MEIRKTIISFLIFVCVFPVSPGSAHLRDLFDKWNAVPATLHEKGVILETINTIDVQSHVSGGLRQKTASAGDVDLLLTVDGAKSFGWDGATFFVYGLGLYGDNPSRNVGDIQGVSSIAAPNTWELFEAWYQQNFLQDRVSLLAGLYDVTSEFDMIRTSSELFLNSSFGTGAEFPASGRNGPSTFPSTSLGIRGQMFVTNAVAVRAVVAEGVPGDPNNPNGTQIIVNEDDGIFANAKIAFYRYKKVPMREGRKDVIRRRPLRLIFQRVGRAAPNGI